MHSWEFVYIFCFISFATSQNVTFYNCLRELISKFHINPHYGCKLYALFLLLSLDEQLHSCRNQWTCWKKSLQDLKDKVHGLWWITSLCIPSSETNFRVWDSIQHRLDIIFEASFFVLVISVFFITHIIWREFKFQLLKNLVRIITRIKFMFTRIFCFFCKLCKYPLSKHCWNLRVP